MIESLQFLFSKKFLLETPTTVDIHYMIYLSAIFCAVIISGIAIWVFTSGLARKILAPFIPATLTFGIIGLIHLFAYFQSLPWLSVRLVAILDTFIFIVYITVIIVRTINILPKMLSEKVRTEKFNQYLPKKKKNNLNNSI